MPVVAAYAASLDPITIGHLRVPRQILEDGLADQVVIIVANNPKKKHLFTRYTAKQLAQITLCSLPREIRQNLILTTEPQEEAHRFSYLVRGIRDYQDADHEMQKLYEEVRKVISQKTKPLPVMHVYDPQDTPYVSSTLARSALFLPRCTVEQLSCYLVPDVARILLKARSECLTPLVPMTPKGARHFNVKVQELIAASNN